MGLKRSSNVGDKPNAERWLDEHPDARRNLKRIIQCMLERYSGSDHGYIDRRESRVEYRFSPVEGEKRFYSLVFVNAWQKHTTVRFYVHKAQNRGKWKTKILKSRSSTDLYALDFKIGLEDSLDQLLEFIESTDTFSNRFNSRSQPTNIDIENDLSEFDPHNEHDGRKRILAEVVRRQGQPQFRNALINHYNGKCVITGCDVLDVLEAAHITPYLGQRTNSISNGLLLRADMHTLWDKQLIAITENNEVWVSNSIKNSMYKKFSGKKIDSELVMKAKSALEKHFRKLDTSS